MTHVWTEHRTGMEGLRRFEQIGGRYAVHGFLISGRWHWEIVLGTILKHRTVVEGFITADDAMTEADEMHEHETFGITLAFK